MPDLSSDPNWLSLREKIFAAPWHLWAHAYGPADDVPPLLEALAVGNPEERESARTKLYGNVFHQGTRWHASPRAVPFLLEMIALPIEGKAWLIEYVLALALGYKEEFLPRGIEPDKYFLGIDEADASSQSPYDEEELGSPEFAAYGAFARDSYRAVEAGCDLFISLLDDEELSTRLASAHALAWFPSRAEDASRALLERWDSMGEAEQANALLAMSVQGLWIVEEERARWASRANAMLDVGGVPGRFAAAIILANWSAASGENWDSRALQVLAQAVSGAELMAWQQEQAAQGEALEWHSRDLRALATNRLADVPSGARPMVMRALQAALAGAAPMTSISLSGTLLTLAFPPGEDGQRAQPQRQDLSPEQKGALRAIAEHGAWRVGESFFANYSQLMRSFGLPDSAEELRDWIEEQAAEAAGQTH